MTRSSASSDRIQSFRASEAAKSFCSLYPGNGRISTRAPALRARSAVPSVLSESMTMISSAHATDTSAAGRFAASFRVISVTVSLGTRGVYR